MTMTLADAVSQWTAVKAEADRLATLERQWRDYIVAAAFGPGEGTRRCPVDNSIELKVVQSMRVKVENGPALHHAFGQATLYNPKYASLAQTAFKWSPSIVTKEWDTLPKPIHDMFAPAITITPNAPQLSAERKDK